MMVSYMQFDIEKDKKYFIQMSVWSDEQRFYRTTTNLNKMLASGRPCSVIIPERTLNKDEIEEYRKFFCSYAKKIKRNCIYFDSPVKIEEV